MPYNKEFFIRFGHIGYLEPGPGIVYAPKDDDNSYTFPESMSESKIEALMKKSVEEDTDFVLDVVKDNPLVYEKDRIY